MRFEEIWKQLESKDSDLKNDESTIEFKSGNLRKLLKQVYEQGVNAGESKSPTSSAGLFDKMFGG